jgi:hypothetical protein
MLKNNINNISDFEYEACNILTKLVYSLYNDSRYSTGNDCLTENGLALYERTQTRLYLLSEKHFKGEYPTIEARNILCF